MSESMHFQRGDRITGALLPVHPEGMAGEWGRLRARMIRECPPAFSRDEWAYLISYLDAGNLLAPWREHWGAPVASTAQDWQAVIRLRDPIALWTPGNVSLLGPLVLASLSLTGARVRIKGSSSSTDLCGALLEFIGKHRDLAPGLAAWVDDAVSHACFDRTDPRNAEMAASARLRLVFGGDDAARGIDALPHPPDSLQIGFIDHQSVAWVHPDEINESTLDTLIRVFAIYGQAGCTSPSAVWLLGAGAGEAGALRNRLAARWNEVMHAVPEPHLASANTLADQAARMLGWESTLAGQREAVIVSGGDPGHLPTGLRTLPILSGSLEDAVAALPANIQTVGMAVPDPHRGAWIAAAARHAKRVVPLARMHHFHAVWDGFAWWRSLFEEVSL